MSEQPYPVKRTAEDDMKARNEERFMADMSKAATALQSDNLALEIGRHVISAVTHAAERDVLGDRVTKLYATNLEYNEKVKALEARIAELEGASEEKEEDPGEESSDAVDQ